MMQTGVVVGVVVSSPPCCSRSPCRRTNQEIFHIFEASFFTLHSFIIPKNTQTAARLARCLAQLNSGLVFLFLWNQFWWRLLDKEKPPDGPETAAGENRWSGPPTWLEGGENQVSEKLHPWFCFFSTTSVPLMSDLLQFSTSGSIEIQPPLPQQFPEVLVRPRLRFCGSSVGLMGASLADRRRPLSAALQAETPEYKMSHVVSFPPPPPDAASPHHCCRCCCCLVIYEFPAPSSLLSHGTPPPHPPAT